MKFLTTVILAFGLPTLSSAEQFPPVKLVDQWDKTINIDSNTKLVLFAADMDSSDIIKESLGELSITNLREKKWVYVADISGMPSMIASMFALPKMRKYAFPIALDNDGKTTANWVKKANQVSVFTLNQLTIEKVGFFANKEALMPFLSQQQTTSETDSVKLEPDALGQ